VFGLRAASGWPNAPQICRRCGPLCWRLLTNRAACTAEQVIELVEWYRARWEIEVFFNVLKHGCRVESLQLASLEKVERALTLFMVVSWRIARLIRLGRTCPDLPASLMFDPDEIRAAHVLAWPLVLALLGAISAWAGGANVGRPALRPTFGGALAIALTAGIGAIFGTVV